MRHIKKDDEVLILGGRDRGKKGKVLRLFPSKSRAVVENINMIKRHTRPNPQRNIKGGIVERESPVHLSNLMVVCRECGKPTRVSYSSLSDGKKVRVCKRCGGTIDK
ncbi:50S ribosomal protein L24 [Acidobacteria bacterium AH-259-G07]|nr:50S ribosomal protein L24 [Acidobacteria bacterium AH-259-L09]MDA2927384.1 50S ribosomal protein L24 [Acidobacteria bacterium AH-259-G07]